MLDRILDVTEADSLTACGGGSRGGSGGEEIGGKAKDLEHFLEEARRDLADTGGSLCVFFSLRAHLSPILCLDVSSGSPYRISHIPPTRTISSFLPGTRILRTRPTYIHLDPPTE